MRLLVERSGHSPSEMPRTALPILRKAWQRKPRLCRWSLRPGSRFEDHGKSTWHGIVRVSGQFAWVSGTRTRIYTELSGVAAILVAADRDVQAGSFVASGVAQPSFTASGTHFKALLPLLHPSPESINPRAKRSNTSSTNQNWRAVLGQPCHAVLFAGPSGPDPEPSNLEHLMQSPRSV